tara:strand:+ start:329 stop:1192 length:864 start_codon:yes stop_codon:yes gene_type:complete
MDLSFLAMLCLIYVLNLPVAYSDETQLPNAAGLKLFQSHVRTDLIHHCLDCHGGKSTKGNFDLTTRETLMDSGFVGESADESYRMQSSAPEALDIDSEPKHIQDLYGIGDEKCNHFARQCLTARRMVERGVRMVQIYSGGMENQRSWDGHNDIHGNHSQFAGETDTPVAGLLSDLDQRGLLKDTLVVWCGEFGRLPVAQKAAKPGRDHNPHRFTAWMAGGGIKGGTTYGESDDIGYKAAVDKVHINDLHATILHLLGINHTRLTYKYNGRRFRLTDVGGEVIQPIIS